MSMRSPMRALCSMLGRLPEPTLLLVSWDGEVPLPEGHEVLGCAALSLCTASNGISLQGGLCGRLLGRLHR